MLRTIHPDVAIIDLVLRDGDGIDLIRELKVDSANIKVLVLSMHDEALFAEPAMHAGTAGYVSKVESSRTIVQAVRTILSGSWYLSPRMLQRILRHAHTSGIDFGHLSIALLSDREIQILELMGECLNAR